MKNPMKLKISRGHKASDGQDHYFVNIDGKRIREKDFAVFKIDEGWHGDIHSRLIAKKVSALRFLEIALHFEQLTLPFTAGWSEHVTRIEITYPTGFSDGGPYITFQFKVPLESWANLYSINEYSDAVHEAVHQYNRSAEMLEEASFEAPISDQDDDGNPTVEFGVAFLVLSDGLLADCIAFWSEKVRSIVETTAEELLKKVRKGSLVKFFDFPPSIRSACEQYLLYFVQFLMDLGIRASAEIKEEAGCVLFSVTPSEGTSALGRIKEALDAYLDLPRHPQFTRAAGEFTDLAVTHLKSQVFFLQSQLELAKATLQAKDAVVQALDFTVFQQKQALFDRQVEAPPKQNEEPILGDTVHLTEYKGKGFRIDLPTILRRLKRSFGVGQDKPGKTPALPPASDQESE